MELCSPWHPRYNADKGTTSPEQHFASSLCPGRTSFYEQYGVIRDVLQNHLTEALMFLIMELPANVSSAREVVQHKLQAFQSLWGLERSSAVLGQYQAYNSQVQEELQEAQGYVSTTPTFAGESLGWALARGAVRAEESRRCESLHAVPAAWLWTSLLTQGCVQASTDMVTGSWTGQCCCHVS